MDNQQQPASKTKVSADATSIEKAERKPVFQVVPNRGGFAPGVTAANLKDVIRDLEDEELLEKLKSMIVPDLDRILLVVSSMKLLCCVLTRLPFPTGPTNPKPPTSCRISYGG